MGDSLPHALSMASRAAGGNGCMLAEAKFSAILVGREERTTRWPVLARPHCSNTWRGGKVVSINAGLSFRMKAENRKAEKGDWNMETITCLKCFLQPLNPPPFFLILNKKGRDRLEPRLENQVHL
jgi:hypothetical protein